MKKGFDASSGGSATVLNMFLGLHSKCVDPASSVSCSCPRRPSRGPAVPSAGARELHHLGAGYRRPQQHPLAGELSSTRAHIQVQVFEAHDAVRRIPESTPCPLRAQPPLYVHRSCCPQRMLWSYFIDQASLSAVPQQTSACHVDEPDPGCLGSAIYTLTLPAAVR